MLDVLQKVKEKEYQKKKIKKRKPVRVTLLIVKMDLPEFVIPVPEELDEKRLQSYKTIEIEELGKLLILGPYKKEDIISIDSIIADWLLEHYGYTVFEKVYVK